MKAAYLDTSLFIGLKFQEPDPAAARLVKKYDLFSSELLIAEVLAFGKCEGIAEELLWDSLEGLSWIIPDASMATELRRAAGVGYVRGADLWHIACACYLSPDPADLAFLTLDERQSQVASELGFQTPIMNQNRFHSH